MSKKICKIISMLVAILIIIIGGMYLIDLDRMKNGKEVVFSTWGTKYTPIINKIANETEDYQKYSKTIGSTKLELNIPSIWNYEEVPRNEENDFYKYALKLYKNDENQCAMLYFYNDPIGICGTGRTSKNITLNNGKEAIIGYYDGNKNWSDISFYNTNEHIAFMNNGLTDTDADEVIEFVKTINIVYEKTFYANIESIKQYNDGSFHINVKGLEENDINYRGNFTFKVDNNMDITLRGEKANVSDLIVGKNISITFTDEIINDISPTPLRNVVKIQILDDEI